MNRAGSKVSCQMIDIYIGIRNGKSFASKVETAVEGRPVSGKMGRERAERSIWHEGVTERFEKGAIGPAKSRKNSRVGTWGATKQGGGTGSHKVIEGLRQTKYGGIVKKKTLLQRPNP